MTTTPGTAFNWKIVKMDCHTSYGGKQNMVFSVHWSCVGQRSANDQLYESEQYGSVSIEPNPNSGFTPFEQLTKETVLEWVWSVEDKARIETIIENELVDKIRPSVVSPSLPWE